MVESHNPHQQPMYIQGGDVENESVSSLYAPGQLGRRVSIVDGCGSLKQYQLIRTDSTMSVAPYEGACAVWQDEINYVVTTDVTERGNPAGVFRCAWEAAGDYMFIQTKGMCPTVKYVDAPTAAATANGQAVILSATAGKADCLAVAAAATYAKLGVTASVISPADQTGAVLLDVPETN
jgi:hypothetical protein